MDADRGNDGMCRSIRAKAKGTDSRAVQAFGRIVTGGLSSAATMRDPRLKSHSAYEVRVGGAGQVRTATSQFGCRGLYDGRRSTGDEQRHTISNINALWRFDCALPRT